MHAVIAESPVIPYLGITLSHDTLNPQSFEACGKGYSSLASSGQVSMDIFRGSFVFLRISASNYEYISLKALNATELSTGRIKQGFILFLRVQFFQNSAQNPDLPLDCLVGALDRQEHHLSFAGGGW